MSNWKINRRHFLTSSGSVFLLPLFESLFGNLALAAGTSDPRRFIGMYMPNGTHNRKGDAVWYPPTGALGSNLGLVLSPFASNASDFSVLKGLQMSARLQALRKSNWAGHASSNTTFLTCQVFTDPLNASRSTVPGSSFDQLYAQKTGKPALVISGGNDIWVSDELPFNYSPYISFKNGAAVEPIRNPVYLYKSMFANLAAAPSLSPNSKSILDSAIADFNDLKVKLGRSDNLKLDEYMTNLRALEQKIAASSGSSGTGTATPSTPPPGTSTSCYKGTQPAGTLDNSDRNGQMQNYVQRVQAFMDMIVLAFQCDLVRSVSFAFDGEVGGRVFNSQIPSHLVLNKANLNSVQNHIGISHTGGRDKCVTRDRLYMYLMTYLVNKLKGATDPSGSRILDNTVLLNGSAIPDGNHKDDLSAGIPMILAGGRNFINPGQCHEVASYDMKDLLYTISTHLNMGLGNFMGGNKLIKI